MYTKDEKRAMVDTYHRMHLARCPTDRALMTVTTARTGETPDEGAYDEVLRFHCPRCEGRFFSDDVDPPAEPNPL